MSNWPTTTVGTHVVQCSEKVKIDQSRAYDTMGVRWYGKGAYLRPSSRPKTKTLNTAHEGNFVFCRIDAQNGPFAIVPPELDGALVTNEFPLYQVNGDTLDPEFLLLCFMHNETLETIGRRRDGRDGRARWKERDFEAWEIPFPPLEQQQAIVEVMGAISTTVNALEVEIYAARKARAALLHQLLETLVIDTDRETLRDVAEWSSGSTPKADNEDYYGGDIPWAIIADVQGRFITKTTRTITEKGLHSIGGHKKIVPPGTVLVTMYGTIGNCAITEVPMATNQAICRGIPNDRVSSAYLRLWIDAHQEDLIKLGEGKTQININKKKIENFPIEIPDTDTQARIVKVMDAVDEHIDALDQEMVEIIVARQALLDAFLLHKFDFTIE